MPQVNVTPDLLNGDLHVIGLTDEGEVIQVDSEGGDNEPYTTAENLVQWGLHNLRKDEVERLLSLPIRDIDRRLLGYWREDITEEENYDLAIALDYQW